MLKKKSLKVKKVSYKKYMNASDRLFGEQKQVCIINEI